MKLLKELNIESLMIYYENILLLDKDRNHFYITPDNLFRLMMGKDDFEIVQKRTRTWIEPYKEKIIKGTFTSVWDGEIEISSKGELLESGEIIGESVDVNGMRVLDEEYFTDETGKRYDVCPTCHTFITKTDFVDKGSGKVERTGCTNPNCENYYENY